MMRIVDPEEYETAVLRRLGGLSGKEVLDVGCGYGRASRRIARWASSVLGVDPDADAIQQARGEAGEHADRCTFRDADIVTLDLPPASFDAVVFTRSL